MRLPIRCCLAIAALALPVPLHAQTNGTPLANLIPDLLLKGITLPGGDLPGVPHAGHFTLGDPRRGGSQAASIPDNFTIRAIEAFGDRFRAQFANFPLGSSTGGFTYSFDEASGIYARNTESFGPAFSERAMTVGRRKLSLGVNYQHMSFDTFGGENLRDGSISFYLPHTDCCGGPGSPAPVSVLDPGMESDVLEAALTVSATTDTVALFANYGVTDRFDVGLAVPITRVDLEANIRARILRLSSANDPTVHTFEQSQNVTEKSFLSEGSATGLGDLLVRTKYNFLRVANAGLALGFDLRLPTGESDDLLGVGTAQGKFFLIASSTNERISPHANIGFTVSGEGKRATPESLGVSDEFNYAGGVEFVAHPKLTLLVDFLGRTLMDAGKIELETRTFDFRPGAGSTAATVPALQRSTTNPLTGEPYRQLALQSGNLSLLLGSTGFKYNAATNLLVMANVLFPLNKAGLRDRLAFAFGVDYAF